MRHVREVYVSPFRQDVLIRLTAIYRPRIPHEAPQGPVSPVPRWGGRGGGAAGPEWGGRVVRPRQHETVDRAPAGEPGRHRRRVHPRRHGPDEALLPQLAQGRVRPGDGLVVVVV